MVTLPTSYRVPGNSASVQALALAELRAAMREAHRELQSALRDADRYELERVIKTYWRAEDALRAEERGS